MFSKLAWINIILAGMVSFFIMKTSDIWTANDELVPDVETVNEAGAKKGIKIVQKKISPQSFYNVITDQNLFSEERIEIIIPKATKKVEKKEEEKPEIKEISFPGKQIKLYGIILMEKYRTALISNPIQGSDQPKDRWVKQGDRLGKMIVTRINRESIHIKEKNQIYKIRLYDEKDRKIQPRSSRAEKDTGVVKKKEKPGRNTQLIRVSKPSSGSKTGMQTEASDDEYETIYTPFGEFKRKKNKN
jgi:hypothetical protein